MTARTISRDIARRYLLGRQGLWPGRRWTGKEGTAAAIRTIGAVQIDPLNVVGRNHDLVLWSRVADYDPAHLDTLLYRDRAFFDYGGLLFIYPMAELPYWRLHMRRRAEEAGRAAWAAEHADLTEAVRQELRVRGPIGNRDFAGNARVDSYRARKDTGLALWHLWITGELMTHGRRGFERLYGFREAIVPPGLDREASEEEAAAFFARRALGGLGLHTAGEWAAALSYRIQRPVDRAEARRRLDALVAEGAAATVRVEGVKDTYYMPGEDLALLADLEAGRVPATWQPLDTTTDDEVTFLAPLDTVLHRRRTRAIFDFEYVWEVYKPASQRRWGYYVLPILYGDRLVARLDPKLDRTSGTLLVNGFWLERDALAEDAAFAQALARGFQRFARFLAARLVDLNALSPPVLRERIEACGATVP